MTVPRAYAQEKLLPRVTAAYLREETDPGIFAEMGELGLLGTTISADYAARVRPMSRMDWWLGRSSVSIPAIAP